MPSTCQIGPVESQHAHLHASEGKLVTAAASPSTSAPPAQDWARNTMAGKLSKGDKLGVVDHSKINYAPFRRSFYIEVPELARMSAADVAAYRRQLDDIKARAAPARTPVPPEAACGSASCCAIRGGLAPWCTGGAMGLASRGVRGV